MKKSLFLILLSGLLFACNTDNTTICTTKLLLTDNLETVYNCTNTVNQLDVPILNEDYIIIRNNESFLEKVTGACVTEIDFSKYDLLIGKKQLTNGLDNIKYDMTIDCNQKDPIVNVTFNLNETTEAPTVTYHIFTPKLGTNQNLEVNLHIKH